MSQAQKATAADRLCQRLRNERDCHIKDIDQDLTKARTALNRFINDYTEAGTGWGVDTNLNDNEWRKMSADANYLKSLFENIENNAGLPPLLQKQYSEELDKINKS